jgi:hypothetical protein
MIRDRDESERMLHRAHQLGHELDDNSYEQDTHHEDAPGEDDGTYDEDVARHAAAAVNRALGER